MGVLAYVDPLGVPTRSRIPADGGAADAPTQSERRGDLSLAWWSSNGRSHLVIGHVPGGAGRHSGANDREASLRSRRLRLTGFLAQSSVKNMDQSTTG